MAMDMCSESPRISFSHDLLHHHQNHHTDEPFRSDDSSDLLILDSTSDFNFCTINGSETQQSSADELFSHGLIRPLQIQQRFVNSTPKPKAPPIPSSDSKENEHKSQQPRSSSFWKIKRSSSLRCDDESRKKSSFWSLPLLSRSNSTGSVPISSKDGHNKNSQKQHKSSSAGVNNKSYSFSQKPPLKKKNSSYYGGGSYNSNIGNGVRISPVLNVHPSYISRGATNLFGLGSLLSNGKDKIKKKNLSKSSN